MSSSDSRAVTAGTTQRGKEGHRARYAPCLTFFVGMLFVVGIQHASAAEITPFSTWNQSPLVQIYGLPAAERSTLLPSGRTEGTLAVDIASNFAQDQASREKILIDGESYRINLGLRYGLGDRFEMGLDLPFIGHGGGVFDNFIEGWHDFFSLPEGGRKDAPRHRLLYSYEQEGNQRLKVDDSSFGMGDIRLSGGMQLYNDRKENPRALALRASLKLPTGSSRKLHGSGGTDFALWLTGSDDYRLSIGHATLFGAAGGMVMSDGDVLPEQRQNAAAFGSLGGGWAPTGWIAFKTEVSGHTALYKGSELRELSNGALQLLIGGTLAFPGGTLLDIGVSEDIAVNTSPDVALHLALRRVF